jgi:hypothetical protein
MEQCIELEETKYCNMAYVLEDKAEPSCQGAIWRSEWAEATQRCLTSCLGTGEGRVLGGVAKHAVRNLPRCDRLRVSTGCGWAINAA